MELGQHLFVRHCALYFTSPRKVPLLVYFTGTRFELPVRGGCEVASENANKRGWHGTEIGLAQTFVYWKNRFFGPWYVIYA